MYEVKAMSINVGGRLMDLSRPRVMGIVNVTPDSFFAQSRTAEADEVEARARTLALEGADLIDVGACSTKPGAIDPGTQEEMRRLKVGVEAVRRAAPGIPVSVDTWRADVARMAVEELGADIVNDISGGDMDPDMLPTVARLGVPYVLTHLKGTPQTMQEAPHYDCLLREVMVALAERVQRLRDLGAKDIILDPGFGFGKTLDHNYQLLAHLEEFRMMELPVLVGVSRKSMVYRLLGTGPDEALNGTTVVHTIALMKGANILRVHDVRQAVEAVRIVEQTRKNRLCFSTLA